MNNCADQVQRGKDAIDLSSGASGGSLHGGASSKVEKAHFAARNKGPENRNLESPNLINNK